jgi:hypothetical protein
VFGCLTNQPSQLDMCPLSTACDGVELRQHVHIGVVIAVLMF